MKDQGSDYQRHEIRNSAIETAKGVGSISTLTFDIDITVETVAGDNPIAPTLHQVAARQMAT